MSAVETSQCQADQLLDKYIHSSISSNWKFWIVSFLFCAVNGMHMQVCVCVRVCLFFCESLCVNAQRKNTALPYVCIVYVLDFLGYILCLSSVFIYKTGYFFFNTYETWLEMMNSFLPKL